MSRPIRIPPETIIGSVEPPAMRVGHIGTWTLECGIPRDIPPGCDLNLILSGTRWIKSEMVCQTHLPGGENYVSAHIVNGPRLYGSPLETGADSKSLMRGVFRVPAEGIRKGSRLRIVLGDTSHGSPGLMGPRFTMRNAFFAIEAPHTGPSDEDWPAHLGKYLAAFIVDFVGGPVDHLRLLAPSQVTVGERFSLTLRAQDRLGNISSERPSRLVFHQAGKHREVSITEEMINPAGALEIGGFTADRPGVLKIRVDDPDTGLRTESNPIRVVGDAQMNLYWGIIHEHTELSDGQGSLDLCYTNFRYGARLDFGAASDHDHRFETTDEMWKMTCEAAKRYNAPGEFVAFLGYEWAKWRRNGDGDRNVYYLDDDRPMFRSETGELDTPEKLFNALSDETALVIPHHSAYTGNFCDWKDHDPKMERLVEIYSVWGNSEMAGARGNPLPVRDPRWNDPNLLKHRGIDPEEFNRTKPPGEEPVGFVQNALAQGWRVGFTAGGDMHLSHPGDDVRKGYSPTDYKAGLVGVWARDKTRESIWGALLARRCFATTSPRMILEFQVNGYPMGSEFSIADEPEARGTRKIDLYVCGTQDIEEVDIICNNRTVHTVSPEGQREVRFAWEDRRDFQEIAIGPAAWCSRPFAFYYVRVRQVDGEMAWASPVWID
jgi:hypothetical protein